MQEVDYTEFGILPLGCEGFYVLARREGMLYVEFWPAANAYNLAVEEAARRNLKKPVDAWEIVRILHQAGRVINMYSVCWGEDLFLTHAYSYNARAYDIARELVRVHTAKHFTDMALAEKRPERDQEPYWPWIQGYSLSLAATNFIELFNQDTATRLHAAYDKLNREEPGWCPKELLEHPAADYNFFKYSGIEEDVKYVLLRHIEDAMKAGKPLSFWHWNALRTVDAERLLGYRYSDADLERWLGANGPNA